MDSFEILLIVVSVTWSIFLVTYIIDKIISIKLLKKMQKTTNDVDALVLELKDKVADLSVMMIPLKIVKTLVESFNKK
jgi:hypothetical protein